MLAEEYDDEVPIVEEFNSFERKRCNDITNLQISMSSLEIDLATGGQPASSLQSSILPAASSSNALQLSPVPSTSRTAYCEEEPIPSTSAGCRLRLLRNRTVSSLHKINRRVIQKPKKNFLPSTEKEVIKFYLNTKLTKVKPTCLETIIEENEDDEDDDDDDNSLYQQIGPEGVKKLAEKAKTDFFNKKAISRALRRSLSCTDGQNVTKATILKRRKRAKTLLNGTTFRPMKITMENFKERLNLMNTSQNSESNNMQQADDEWSYHEDIHTSD